MLHTALATAAALVALAFALSTYERWLDRRRRHELAWSVALALFAVAAGTLAAGEAVGWNEPLFRLYYLTVAVLNVPVLALGTVYLHGGGRRAGLVALAFCAFAAGVLPVARSPPPSLGTSSPKGATCSAPCPASSPRPHPGAARSSCSAARSGAPTGSGGAACCGPTSSSPRAYWFCRAAGSSTRWPTR